MKSDFLAIIDAAIGRPDEREMLILVVRMFCDGTLLHRDATLAGRPVSAWSTSDEVGGRYSDHILNMEQLGSVEIAEYFIQGSICLVVRDHGAPRVLWIPVREFNFSVALSS